MSFSVTFLGTGTSQGVPVIACECEVCLSGHEKDQRLRSSIMFSIDNENYVIDTGPDFRQQMLRNNVQTLSAVIYTHEHKDHVAGVDDVRAFNYREKRDMEVYCTERVEATLRREFSYVFSGVKSNGLPQIHLNRIGTSPFNVNGKVEFIPIEVMHHELPVLGFRYKNFAYITDAKTVHKKEREKFRGVKVLVVNALRKEEHISHFNLEQALNFIEDIGPEKAYLTHISHLFGKHEDIEEELPENVGVAYDGLILNFET